MRRPKVLFAILDWGLGHASRSTPLAEWLVDNDCEVTIASSGTAQKWLEGTFPAAEIIVKPGIDIHYAKRFTSLKIAAQGGAFLNSILAERKWTKSLHEKHQFDFIVSDNCYGVKHEGVPSFLITHQLNLPLPSLVKKATKSAFEGFFEGFSEIWVPDSNSQLSGQLSKASLNIKVEEIGSLSHLTNSEPASDGKIVGMVSGPEPHRSLLSGMMGELFEKLNTSCIIFGGIPDGEPKTSGQVQFIPHPTSEQLSTELSRAKYIVCRSGYSSLMDLAHLKKQALLVPTPDQKEQEYLANHWKEQFNFATVAQQDFKKLTRLPELGGQIPQMTTNQKAFAKLKEVIELFS
ncbi:MAG: glycosyltransferase [Flavobacteriales bacterium]|nr:glycosyltransferase [Flavobacteriales bacterium]